MSKQAKLLYKVVLCALFAGLSFVGCMLEVKLPVGAVHLGNFVVVMAALLCGGLIGGISGSLGMGLFDYFIYYHGFSAGVVRTIVLKFFMGLIVGYVFRFLVKKNVNAKPWNYVLTGLIAVGLGLTLWAYFAGPFQIGTKTVTFHWIIPIFFGVVFVLYILVLIFGRKMKKISYLALTAVSVGTLFNIFGEIFIKAVLYYWIDAKYTTFDAAWAYCLASLPSVSFTAMLTCILSAFIYYPVYKATRGLNRISFLELENLDDSESQDEEEIEEQGAIVQTKENA